MATKGKKNTKIQSNTMKGSESGEMSDSLRSALQKGSETAYDYYCNLCDKDNKYVEAKGYCTNCRAYLCQECYTTHLKPKPLRHHILLDQHRMPKDVLQRQSNDMCTEKCTVHKNETLKFYCAEHSKFGCLTCISLQHRKCECVDYIPDIAGDVLKSREYKDMSLKVKTLKETAHQAIKTAQNKTQTSTPKQSNVSEFIKQLRTDLNAAVDKVEALFMKDTGRIRDENQKRLKSVEDQYKQLLKEFGTLDYKLTSLENQGQLCQIFFSMKRSQGDVDALEVCLQQQQDQSNITENVIKINDDLQSLIQQPNEMVTLKLISGQQMVKPRDIQSSQPVLQPKFPSVPSKGMAKNRPVVGHEAVGKTGKLKKTAVQVADIKVRIDGYSEMPWITGSVVLPGDKLVIVDDDNTTAKLINLQSNKVVSDLECNRGIWDIAAVTNTQVALTNTTCNKILFINVTNKLTLDHKVKVKGRCYGIACISGDKFVITYDDPVKVGIISRRGELLQTVVTENRGRQLLTLPWYVALSPDRQTIYISDKCRHTVTSLDLSGQVKATYKDDELKVPCGLTVDKVGVLYVCGGLSNNIHRLTPGLHKIQILLQKSDGIVKPQSVSYNEEQNKLYIGMDNSDIVKVYQLH